MPDRHPTDATPFSHPLRVAELAGRKPTRFALVPTAAERAAIAAALGLLDLPALAFRGELRPAGRQDWTLAADLAATVVQPCVATLAPVTTAIAEPVVRRYMADLPDPGGDEIEMPEDDSLEPLGAVIDPGLVMTEALALALPLYPRAEGAGEGAARAAGPGVTPMTDEDARPFANLAELMRRKKD
jgi:uncharacterized metal-binding protein YceD (DUF177 family)